MGGVCPAGVCLVCQARGSPLAHSVVARKKQIDVAAIELNTMTNTRVL